MMEVPLSDNIAKAPGLQFCYVLFISVMLLKTCQDALDGKQGKIFMIGNEKLVKSALLRCFFPCPADRVICLLFH